MTQKNTLFIAAIIIALAVAGYLVYASSSSNKDLGPTPQGTETQGKINIDAVCTGALAYMTFPDGASADAFVEECKAGEHPDVIERYKQEMGLGDGAAI